MDKAEQPTITQADELLREIFLHGHSEGWTGNQTRRDVQHVDAEKGWSLYVSNGALEKTKARHRTASLAAQEVDSGMSGDAVERAEWFWTNLPTGRKWTGLATHEKALVCHQIARITPSPAAQDGLVEALTYLESEARRFAGMYPEASDGRNTFLIFADKIASVSAIKGDKS